MAGKKSDKNFNKLWASQENANPDNVKQLHSDEKQEVIANILKIKEKLKDPKCAQKAALVLEEMLKKSA